jgi:hypothetical protein
VTPAPALTALGLCGLERNGAGRVVSPALVGPPPGHDAPDPDNGAARFDARCALRCITNEATLATITGWVRDLATPEQSIRLELVEGETQLATAVASNYRLDLAFAGIGDGRHGFAIGIEPGLLSAGWHTQESAESALC